MEVHPEVFRWLGALQLVDGRTTPPVSRWGKVPLDEATGDSFENGQVCGCSISRL
jgi:hypothetical protein